MLISWLCKCLPCAGDPVVQLCAPLPPSQPQTPTPTLTGPPWTRRRSSSATSWPTLRPPPSRTPRWPSRTVGSLKVCVVCIHPARPTAKWQYLTSCAHFRILLPAITVLGKEEVEGQAPAAKKAKGPAKTKDELQVLAAVKEITAYTSKLEVPWCRCSTVSSPAGTYARLATVYTSLRSSAKVAKVAEKTKTPGQGSRTGAGQGGVRHTGTRTGSGHVPDRGAVRPFCGTTPLSVPCPATRSGRFWRTSPPVRHMSRPCPVGKRPDCPLSGACPEPLSAFSPISTLHCCLRVPFPIAQHLLLCRPALTSGPT